MRWLLNIAHMTRGQLPGWRSRPPADCRRRLRVRGGRRALRGRRAPRPGFNSFSMAGGVIVDDFDSDGRLDVVTSSIDSCAPHAFLPPQRRRHVHRAAAQRRAGDQLGGLNIVQADYNNDGCIDILVLRGGWEVAAAQVAAAQQLRRHVHRRHGGERPGRPASPARRRRSGPTSTTTASSTCSSATRTARASCSSTRATARSRTSRTPAGVDRAAFTQGRGGRRLRQRRLAGLLRLELRRRELPLSQQPRRHVHRGRARRPASPGRGRGFAAWFFDYDNDGWPDLFVDQLLHRRSTRRSATYLGTAAQRRRR